MMALFSATASKASELADKLASADLLAKADCKQFIKNIQSEGKYLAETLLLDKRFPQSKVLEILSKCYQLPTADLQGTTIMPQVISMIPKEVAEQHQVIVFKKMRQMIFVATTRPEDEQIVEFITKKTKCKVEIFITTPESIKYGLEKYRSDLSEDFEKIIEQSIREAKENTASVEKMAQFVPIVKMVNSIIERALNSGASDIHIEPQAGKIKIRFRIDGILHTIVELPKDIAASIVARIKILANLKIDEHMVPQDGRFQFDTGTQEVPIRVSIIPTLHGAKVALRLLEMNQKKFTLRRLGLNKRDHQLLKDKIKVAHGMILVTGPTGSGKTTTLYTLLRMLNQEDVNICTVEDPVEYDIEGINQTQINPRVGLTFANGLKSLLRQDPNIVMVGEIRDVDTAQIAINAAMTGHLVLSTIHTNNAFLTPQRLIEMGVPGYLVSPVINVIIGQRLVRRLCRHCRSKYRDNQKVFAEYVHNFQIQDIFDRFKQMNLIPVDADLAAIPIYRAQGCKKCNFTGYQGRLGIYEIVDIDEHLRKIILENPVEEKFRQAATSAGALTMLEDGVLKVLHGQTTLNEILRVTKE